MIEFYKDLAKRLPARTIMGEEGPYLTRYSLANLPDGGHVYIHHFHRGDSAAEFHNHPWASVSLVLGGGYWETRLENDRPQRRAFWPGDTNRIDASTFHRIELLDMGQCWTLFVTGPRVQSWGFVDQETKIFTPWREALAARGLL